MEIYLDEVNESINDEFDLHFKFLDNIASGAFGNVVKAIYLEIKKVVAVKIITKGVKKERKINRLKQEISILKQLKHKNIVEFYGYIETNNKLFIIMEYIKSGTLKSLIEKRKNGEWFTEEESSTVIRCLGSAIDYLHYREICHRDIKPENILFENTNDLNTLKVVDFGLSAQFFEVLEEYEFCGTYIYMAPEQLEKKVYTKSIDIWSCGIILYMLLNKGKHPLYVKGVKNKDYLEKLKNPKIAFTNKTSKMAKLLVFKLLESNPSRRYTADKILKHPWITRDAYDGIPLTYHESWKRRSLTKNFTEVIIRNKINIVGWMFNFFKKFY